MQTFILLYVEGGSYISEDEEEWEFVVLFVILLATVLAPSDAFIGTRSASDGMPIIQRPTISLVTLHFILSSVSQTRYVYA